jgi:hypothetical protein
LECVRGLDILDEDTPIHLLPPMFSRVEKPANYYFKPDLQPHVQEEDKEDTETKFVFTSRSYFRC